MLRKLRLAWKGSCRGLKQMKSLLTFFGIICIQRGTAKFLFLVRKEMKQTQRKLLVVSNFLREK